MNQYGETIYGTRGGEVEPHPWGVTTRRDNRLFVHILDLNDRGLSLPRNKNKGKRACEYLSRKAVKFTRVDGGIALQLSKKPTEIDYVVELEF